MSKTLDARGGHWTPALVRSRFCGQVRAADFLCMADPGEGMFAAGAVYSETDETSDKPGHLARTGSSIQPQYLRPLNGTRFDFSNLGSHHCGNHVVPTSNLGVYFNQEIRLMETCSLSARAQIAHILVKVFGVDVARMFTILTAACRGAWVGEIES